MSRALPPFKVEALRLLTLGPVRCADGSGWTSQHSEQVFNSHTIGWLCFVGWAEFTDESRREAEITPEGRAVAGVHALQGGHHDHPRIRP